MNNKLEWLQALRGLAALMVLFFHLGPQWALVPPLEPLSKLMHWGFSGVDVFFVISGYVVYQSGRRSLPVDGYLGFLKMRFARIYFGYWPALAAFILWCGAMNNTWPGPAEKFLGSALLVYRSLFDHWLPVAWSLTYELYFYMLLGLFMLLPHKRHPLAIWGVTAAAITWNLAWLIYSPGRTYNGAYPLSFLLGGFLVEFMLGASIAVLLNYRQSLFQSRWVLLPCGVLIVLGFYVGSLSPYFDRVEIMRATSYGLAAAGAVVIALFLEQTVHRPHRVLILIGNSSFSLYLLHSLILTGLGVLGSHAVAQHPSLLLAYSLATPVATVVLCYGWYLVVEARTIRWAKAV